MGKEDDKASLGLIMLVCVCLSYGPMAGGPVGAAGGPSGVGARGGHHHPEPRRDQVGDQHDHIKAALHCSHYMAAMATTSLSHAPSCCLSACRSRAVEAGLKAQLEARDVEIATLQAAARQFEVGAVDWQWTLEESLHPLSGRGTLPPMPPLPPARVRMTIVNS